MQMNCKENHEIRNATQVEEAARASECKELLRNNAAIRNATKLKETLRFTVQRNSKNN